MARDDNPFFTGGNLPMRPERGTDAALHQLELHCDFLNACEVRAGTQRRWRVTGEAPQREVAPYTLPSARNLLRQAAA